MSAKTKTILVVTPYFPPLGGGLERYALEIARRLDQNYKWRIVFASAGTKNGGDTITKTDGITIYKFGYNLSFSNTPFSFSWFRKIRALIKKEHPDLIHIHTPVPGIGNIAALLAGKTPVVVTYHAGSMIKGRLIPDIAVWFYERILMHVLLRKAKKIVCASDFVRDQFLGRWNYQSKSVTITPGTNTQTFVPDPKKRAKDPTILFVAGLGKAEQHKGLQHLLDATKTLSKEISNLKLVVVGEGDMRPEYEKRAKSMGLDVRFAGRLGGEPLISEYQKAHIFVLPSKNDNFSMVVLEAMSCGLPVIASRIGGLPTLIDDTKTGFLITAGDTGDLTKRLRELLKDPALRRKMGDAGRIKLRQFDWSAKAKEYAELFNEVLTSELEKKPSIAHVAAYYPPHLGGMERVAQMAAEHLAKLDYAVEVFTSDCGVDKNKTYRQDYVSVHRLKSFEFAHTPFAPTLLWHLLRLPKKSIIHLHLSQVYYPEIVLFVAKLRGFPYVVHFHLDVGASGPLGFLFLLYKKILWKPILQLANKVIVCSPDQALVVQKKYRVKRENITVVPNGVSDTFFTQKHYVLPDKKFQLLSIGRLVIQKRVERLIEAVARINIPVHLTIVGDGDEQPHLEALVKKYNLKNVSFEGRKNDEQMQEYHRKNDVFLISSDKEGGTSLVILEAMAGGLPIIGTNVSGISGMVKGKGILVDEPYAQGFADAIEKLWKNKEELIKLSTLGKKTALKYSWDNTVLKIAEVYNSIL